MVKGIVKPRGRIRTQKQRLQFFRYRFKGWIFGSCGMLGSFLLNCKWLTDTEMNALLKIRSLLAGLKIEVDENTKIIKGGV